MKATFQHMGNTYITAKALLDDLNIKYEIPPYNNKQTLELGTKITPEMACLPLKLSIGNFIESHKKGADTIIMAGGCGPCRLGYYCQMQSEILNDNGYNMDVITLEWPKKGIKELFARIKKLTGGCNVFRILKAIINATIVSKKVDELERFGFKIRPRELNKGSTDSILKAFQNNVLAVYGSNAIKELILKAKNELSKVKTEKDFKPLRVGIVGEIYSTIDSHTNFYIESKLGNMQVEVDRAVNLSGWIIEHIIKGTLHIPRDLRFEAASKPYLGAMIGGHAQETIGNTVLYAKDGYDGIIQIYPLTCMPEIVAQSILPKVSEDYDIPILTLLVDEMTGEAGIVTRLEAFVDLLEKRRESRIFEGNGILSGN